jgi:cell division protein FtsI (penicillin-binding protein 3)
LNGIPPRRLAGLVLVLGIWAACILARLVDVQLIRGSEYRARADRQQEHVLSLPARRGSILDLRGRELAASVEASSVFAVPDRVTNIPVEARVLSRILGLRDADLRERLAGDRSFVWIARQIDDAAAAAIAEAKLPGIALLAEPKRRYPNGTLAANVLGFVGIDGRGLAGAEYGFDGSVAGRPGQMRVARDARQGQYALAPVAGREPRPGSSAQLTLDADLQYAVERELAAGVAAAGARGGSAVLIDPWSGDVLAMASIPTFDPNRYVDFPSSAWRNRPISDNFEPGSAFKVVTGATAINLGLVAPEDPIDCGQGAIQIGNYWIHDAERQRFGIIPLTEVIARSSNVGIIRVGLKLGPERLYSGARAFGIGELTGVDLPGENPGILREVSRWSGLSNAEISMGQEVAVTSLQLAVAISAIANGGSRIHPRLLRRIIGADGAITELSRPAPVRILSASTAAAMNEILQAVVREGTGKRAAIDGYTVAGKTGTAQKAIGRGYGRDCYVATFAGYAPATNPRLALVVTVEEPRGDYFASEVSAPIFSRIAARAMSVLGVPPNGSSVVPAPPPPTQIARAPSGLPPGLVPAALVRGGSRADSPRLPDLAGLAARDAVATLARLGVEARLSGNGFVVRQSPAAGFELAPGAICEILLSPHPAS